MFRISESSRKNIRCKTSVTRFCPSIAMTCRHTVAVMDTLQYCAEVMLLNAWFLPISPLGGDTCDMFDT